MLPLLGRKLSKRPEVTAGQAELERSRPRSARIGAALVATAGLLGSLGEWIGQDIALLALLSLPVVLCSWKAGRRWGIAAALVGTAGWWLIPVPAPDAAETSLLAVSWVGVLLSGIAWLVGALQVARRTAAVLSQTEPLTGLLNRNAFLDRLQMEIERSRRLSHPLALAFLDCDDFKEWNDTRGHLAGDELLMAVARVLRSSTRSYDAVARMGGDEFAIMYPEVPADDAAAAARRLQCNLRKLAGESNWAVTFSIGVITLRELSADPNQIITAADELMYHAKQSGKDRVVIQAFGSRRHSHPEQPTRQLRATLSAADGGVTAGADRCSV